jgi:hypothetical protein
MQLLKNFVIFSATRGFVTIFIRGLPNLFNTALPKESIVSVEQYQPVCISIHLGYFINTGNMISNFTSEGDYVCIITYLTQCNSCIG